MSSYNHYDSGLQRSQTTMSPRDRDRDRDRDRSRWDSGVSRTTTTTNPKDDHRSHYNNQRSYRSPRDRDDAGSAPSDGYRRPSDSSRVSSASDRPEGIKHSNAAERLEALSSRLQSIRGEPGRGAPGITRSNSSAGQWAGRSDHRQPGGNPLSHKRRSKSFDLGNEWDGPASAPVSTNDREDLLAPPTHQAYGGGHRRKVSEASNLGRWRSPSPTNSQASSYSRDRREERDRKERWRDTKATDATDLRSPRGGQGSERWRSPSPTESVTSQREYRRKQSEESSEFLAMLQRRSRNNDVLVSVDRINTSTRPALSRDPSNSGSSPISNTRDAVGYSRTRPDISPTSTVSTDPAPADPVPSRTATRRAARQAAPPFIDISDAGPAPDLGSRSYSSRSNGGAADITPPRSPAAVPSSPYRGDDKYLKSPRSAAHTPPALGYTPPTDRARDRTHPEDRSPVSPTSSADLDRPQRSPRGPRSPPGAALSSRPKVQDEDAFSVVSGSSDGRRDDASLSSPTSPTTPRKYMHESRRAGGWAGTSEEADPPARRTGAGGSVGRVATTRRGPTEPSSDDPPARTASRPSAGVRSVEDEPPARTASRAPGAMRGADGAKDDRFGSVRQRRDDGGEERFGSVRSPRADETKYGSVRERGEPAPSWDRPEDRFGSSKSMGAIRDDASEDRFLSTRSLREPGRTDQRTSSNRGRIDNLFGELEKLKSEFEDSGDEKSGKEDGGAKPALPGNPSPVPSTSSASSSTIDISRVPPPPPPGASPEPADKDKLMANAPIRNWFSRLVGIGGKPGSAPATPPGGSPASSTGDVTAAAGSGAGTPPAAPATPITPESPKPAPTANVPAPPSANTNKALPVTPPVVEKSTSQFSTASVAAPPTPGTAATTAPAPAVGPNGSPNPPASTLSSIRGWFSRAQKKTGDAGKPGEGQPKPADSGDDDFRYPPPLKVDTTGRFDASAPDSPLPLKAMENEDPALKEAYRTLSRDHQKLSEQFKTLTLKRGGLKRPEVEAVKEEKEPESPLGFTRYTLTPIQLSSAAEICDETCTRHSPLLHKIQRLNAKVVNLKTKVEDLQKRPWTPLEAPPSPPSLAAAAGGENEPGRDGGDVRREEGRPMV
ncbi:hypothetical protein HDU96_008954 [Phlyctochytrium bullatum]|nr:hypothetical protein HDU96_008954 [Phlyctochytrium bullatum]